MRQLDGQLRLSGQNDLQQLSMRRLEIGEQANRLGHGIVQILRFVYHQDEASALQQLREEHFVQLVVQGHETQAAGISAQLAEDVLQEFALVTLRLKKV